MNKQNTQVNINDEPFFPADYIRGSIKQSVLPSAIEFAIDNMHNLCDLISASSEQGQSEVANQLCLLGTNLSLLEELAKNNAKIPEAITMEIGSCDAVVFDYWLEIKKSESIVQQSYKDIIPDIKETLIKVKEALRSNQAVTQSNNKIHLDDLFTFNQLLNIKPDKDHILVMAEGIYGICKAIRSTPTYSILSDESSSNKTMLISLALSLRFEYLLFTELLENIINTEKYALLMDDLCGHIETIKDLPILLDDGAEKSAVNDVLLDIIEVISKACRVSVED